MADDILSDVAALYGCPKVVHGTAGEDFTFVSNKTGMKLTLKAPDTRSENWNLHADSIWVGSLFLAEFISILSLPSTSSPTERLNILELGAGAGLPGILLAKLHPNEVSVTLSDYPDDGIIDTLKYNLAINELGPPNDTVAAFDWLAPVPSEVVREHGYDIMLAADTLWSSPLHTPFLNALSACLSKSPHANAYVAAGLHTGRYTIARFLELLNSHPSLELQSVMEYEVADFVARDWKVDREEDEAERRRWVILLIVGRQVHGNE